MTQKPQGPPRRPPSDATDQPARQAPPAPRAPGARRYRVLVGISYPTDPRLIAAKLRGDRIAEVDYITTRREIGDIVSDIPELCLPWLAAQGIIEPIDPPSAPAPEPPADKEGDE